MSKVKNIIDMIMKLEERPSWHEYFLMVAFLISKRASCDRLKVGCVITFNNRVVSTGYNGHIKGAVHTSVIVDGHEQMTIHAETNAVADAAARSGQLEGSTAYITSYPCINCAKSLIAAGIKEIFYCNDYKNNIICEKLYKIANVNITKIVID
ncbi:MAG: hypothetical protein Harvfovirus2_6 [Harvfovirus sp.]|uniref:CMP/dCMP-type deaminase domain-containing protein n=1 Tax=Harvfovirus sp. TaxID=2487768 RepID=A0A3G4ZZS3_9VIRU|nr:MAG: hypothetical protein Harvfovirus2_6 [Harvfovirus sp.]